MYWHVHVAHADIDTVLLLAEFYVHVQYHTCLLRGGGLLWSS